MHFLPFRSINLPLHNEYEKHTALFQVRNSALFRCHSTLRDNSLYDVNLGTLCPAPLKDIVQAVETAMWKCLEHNVWVWLIFFSINQEGYTRKARCLFICTLDWAPRLPSVSGRPPVRGSQVINDPSPSVPFHPSAISLSTSEGVLL